MERYQRGKEMQAETRVSPKTCIEVAAESLDKVLDDGDPDRIRLEP